MTDTHAATRPEAGMTLALATLHGEQLAPAWHGPRYIADGASIRDQGQPHRLLPLIEAELLCARLTEDAARAKDDGSPLARIYARDAVSLERAIKHCRRPAELRRGWFNMGARA